MVISNSFATHPGKKAEMCEKINEDFAHAWESNGVYFQALADGNGRDDVLLLLIFLKKRVQMRINPVFKISPVQFILDFKTLPS